MNLFILKNNFSLQKLLLGKKSKKNIRGCQGNLAYAYKSNCKRHRIAQPP